LSTRSCGVAPERLQVELLTAARWYAEVGEGEPGDPTANVLVLTDDFNCKQMGIEGADSALVTVGRRVTEALRPLLAPDTVVDELVAEAQRHGIADDLDTYVHDAASQPASDINNAGLRKQIRYLCEEHGAAGVREILAEIAKDAETNPDDAAAQPAGASTAAPRGTARPEASGISSAPDPE
jgi:hypothetical protein